jgi:hypothetical protein
LTVWRKLDKPASADTPEITGSVFIMYKISQNK